MKVRILVTVILIAIAATIYGVASWFGTGAQAALAVNQVSDNFLVSEGARNIAEGNVALWVRFIPFATVALVGAIWAPTFFKKEGENNEA